MRFHELPRRLQLYILAQPLLLLPLAFFLARLPQPDNGWLLAALIAATALFSTWKLELTIGEGRMTPVFATVCLAMLLQGGTAAVVCSALGALITTYIRPPRSGWQISFLRPQAYYAWFNTTNGALSGALAALAFEGVRRLAPRGDWNEGAALSAFTLCYFLANTAGVTLAIASQQRLPSGAVWVQNFLWTAPGFFASAAAALGIQAVFPWMGGWSLLFLSPLYLIYYSYRLYMDRVRLYTDRVQQNMVQIQELHRLNESLISSLARTIDERQQEAQPRLTPVQCYARALAQAAGLCGPQLEAVVVASLVHEIGRRPIPEQMPSRTTGTSAAERRSAPAGAAGEAEWSASVPHLVLGLLTSQHERWDGQGHPDGLAGDEVPLGSRVLAVVGMFDVLSSSRPFRNAMTPKEALRVLREGAGKQFDPGLVALFEQVLPQAQLEAERLAATERERVPGQLAPRPASS